MIREFGIYLTQRVTRAIGGWSRWGHGVVDVKKALEESVDTFFYQVAFDLGIDRLSSWMNKFGFGEYTGIDIHEESSANMPTREWNKRDIEHLGIKAILFPLESVRVIGQQRQCKLQKHYQYLLPTEKSRAPHLLRATMDKTVANPKPILSPIKTYPSIKGVKESYWKLAEEGMHLVATGSSRNCSSSLFMGQNMKPR